jgi:hypothetical protein
VLPPSIVGVGSRRSSPALGTAISWSFSAPEVVGDCGDRPLPLPVPPTPSQVIPEWRRFVRCTPEVRQKIYPTDVICER